MNYANELYHDGVTVVCNEHFQKRVHELRNELEHEFQHFPEFIKHPPFADMSREPNMRYGMGGTSFLGNPSVFHNEFVRRMRDHVMYVLIRDLFKPLLQIIEAREGRTNLKLQQYVDRVMARPVMESASNESWHRDVAPGAEEMDNTFGGWINLDVPTMIRKKQFSGNQTFVCVKGTHKDARTGNLGFATIADADKPEFKRQYEAQANTTNCDDHGNIVIPPGCIVVFYENLVHSVVGKPVPFTRVRQFFGWRLTPKSNPGVMHSIDQDGREYTSDEFAKLLLEQAVIPLKSGQVPPMYPGYYRSAGQASLVNWRKFKNAMLQPNSMRYEDDSLDTVPVYDAKGNQKFTNKKGEMIPVTEFVSHHRGNVKNINYDYTRSMKSLRDIQSVHGIPLYREYSAREIAMLVPNTEFQLTNPETGQIERVKLHARSASHSSSSHARSASRSHLSSSSAAPPAAPRRSPVVYSISSDTSSASLAAPRSSPVVYSISSDTSSASRARSRQRSAASDIDLDTSSESSLLTPSSSSQTRKRSRQSTASDIDLDTSSESSHRSRRSRRRRHIQASSESK